MKRVFLIVLDSCGVGALPDAATFGDAGTHTLKTCYQTGKLHIPQLSKMGLGNIEGLSFLGTTPKPTAMYGRAAERSAGKDTTTGHWELAGIVSEKPMPTYPDGFPSEIIDQIIQKTGRGVLCNKPYSGTEVIRDYGDEQVRTGDLIVYTSADSVLQVAAHETVIPIETLYEYCRMIRQIMQGKHAVGRVIARPFVGQDGQYTRTANRRDFSLKPPKKTMLDAIKEQGKASIAIGKITDIFAGQGVSESVLTHSNDEGMAATAEMAKRDFEGVCFTNLVDFDMIYGHRNDAAGYTLALNAFDEWLGGFLPLLRPDDLLIITADHGCDPGDVSTDHTREYVPVLVYGPAVTPRPLHTLPTFMDVAATVCAYLGVPYQTEGVSML